MLVETDSLKWLLSLMQRRQTIDGKSISQVHSLLMKAEGGRLSACTLVKDGVTSLMRLSIPCGGEGEFALTDIDAALGVLKYHGGALTITPYEDKVRFKTTGKQTTLSANREARAFPHTPETIALWSEKSEKLAAKIDVDALEYRGNDGEVYGCAFVFPDLDTTALYEAFRCDSMNGQKFNKYTVSYDDALLSISVGGELKGKTTTEVAVNNQQHQSGHMYYKGGLPPVTYNGGLEYIFQNLNNDATIGIWDFSEKDMGYPMLIGLGDGDFIFQISNEG